MLSAMSANAFRQFHSRAQKTFTQAAKISTRGLNVRIYRIARPLMSRQRQPLLCSRSTVGNRPFHSLRLRSNAKVPPDVVVSAIGQRLRALGCHPSSSRFNDHFRKDSKVWIFSCKYLGCSFRRELLVRLGFY